MIVTFADEILRIWMGAEFAAGGTRPLQWLAIGTFINSVAFVPFALIQGMGRPRITATMHLIELPLYVVALALLTQWRGIDGASIAWTLRVSLDAVLLFAAAGVLMQQRRGVVGSFILAVAAASGITLGVAALEPLWLRGVAVCFVLGAYVAISWTRLLDTEARQFIRRIVVRGRG